MDLEVADGYLVDGRDRRIGKKVNGVLERAWLYLDALRPAAELDSAGNVVARFIYAGRVNVPAYMVKGGAVYRLFHDHLGSVRLVVDVVTGAVAQRLDYDEFGRVLLDNSPGFQPFGFAGGLYDPDTELVRLGARDYDAEVGRWTAKDPVSFWGADTNLHRYAFGDPINLVDPSGLCVGECREKYPIGCKRRRDYWKCVDVCDLIEEECIKGGGNKIKCISKSIECVQKCNQDHCKEGKPFKRPNEACVPPDSP
jgi:RHS repeat-associated protein